VVEFFPCPAPWLLTPRPPPQVPLGGDFDDIPLLGLEDVQRQLRRSRASVYRYANTDNAILNPAFDPQKLNPEVRTDKDAPLLFHPQEVRRFARDVLGLNPTIEVQPPAETLTHQLLREILAELRTIRDILRAAP